MLVYFLFSPALSHRLYSFVLFRPNKERGDKVAFRQRFGNAYRTYSVLSGENHLRAMLFENSKADNWLCLVNMGRDGDIERRLSLIEDLLSMGLNVLIYEYPGYGESSGSPTLENVRTSGFDMLYFAIDHLGFEQSKIILYGESMGTANTCEQLSKFSLAGAILKSGFSSLERATKELYPVMRLYPSWLFPETAMNNARLLKEVSCRILIVHGAKDRMLGLDHAYQLKAAGDSSSRQLLILPESRHAYMPEDDRAIYRNRMERFIEKVKFP